MSRPPAMNLRQLAVLTARAGLRAARWARPHAIWALRALATGTAAAAAAAGRLLVRHRHVAVAMSTRVLWWTSLWLLVVGGTALVGEPDPSLPPAHALHTLSWGLALVAICAPLAASRRVRWAAVALGAAHGGLAVLAWTTAAG